MAFSGILSTFKVSSNSLINGALGSVVDNVAGRVINVALGDSLGQQVTSALGLPAGGNSNFLGSIVSPGLLSSGNQALSQVLTKSLGSGALGSLAGNLVTNTLGQFAGGILSGLNPNLSIPPNKYFAGAGAEEDADYGGNLYTPGPVGPDIVFSIKPAQSSASAEANAQITGFTGGTVGTSIPWGEVPSFGTDLFGENIISPATQASFLGESMQGFTEGTNVLSQIGGKNFSIPQAWTGSLLGGNPLVSLGGPPNSDVKVTPQGNILLGSSDSPQKPSTISYESIFPPTTGTQSFFNAAAIPLEAYTDPNLASAVGFGSPSPSAGVPGSESTSSGGWTFTTAPKDVSWDTSAKVDRVPIFGTNQPPVISGSRGMRDLTLSNALIEGFSMFKSVENKIIQLEALLNYTLTTSYVKVPVYWVTVSDKKYGAGNGDGGYFVIKSIKVKEEMRDLKGRGTRAVVDVAFTQVPPYQVDDGRDLASKSVAGGKSILSNIGDTQAKAIEQGRKDGTISVVEQGSLGGGGGTGPGGSRNPKPGQVDIGGGDLKPLSQTRTVNGVSRIEKLDLPTLEYVPEAEWRRRQRARQSPAAAPTPTPPTP